MKEEIFEEGCPDCEGTGAEEHICAFCNGSGEGSYDGSGCRMCNGRGVMVFECSTCHGTGVIPEED